MIAYQTDIESVTAEKCAGFFVGWPHPPSPRRHLDILRAADHVVVAIDSETGRVIGFINAISDGIHAAYIPLLEVLPEYRKQGIGAELVRRMLDQLNDLYMIDLMCDVDVQPFYERLGMTKATGMRIRNFERQAAELTLNRE